MSTRACEGCGSVVIVNDAVDELVIRAALKTHERYCTANPQAPGSQPRRSQRQIRQDHTPKPPRRSPMPLEVVQTPDPVPHRPHPRELLTHRSKAVAKAAAAVLKSVAALDAAWKDDAAKGELRAERDRLRAELATVEALLKDARAVHAAPARDWKAIRAWAAENGMDCPASGKVPGRVVEVYDKARTA